MGKDAERHRVAHSQGDRVGDFCKLSGGIDGVGQSASRVGREIDDYWEAIVLGRGIGSGRGDALIPDWDQLLRPLPPCS